MYTRVPIAGGVVSVCVFQSGRSCGYGFVEFGCEEVARIVADTMHNYLMHNKLLKC